MHQAASVIKNLLYKPNRQEKTDDKKKEKKC
jgi:hypothetical protein